MKIQTGKGQIPLLPLLAIWAISLTVNLPGLAITPLLSDLDRIFPNTSELEIQLLTVIPNLIIIPFVLLSGRLAESGRKLSIVILALLIYLISGILYIFASSMTELILIGVLLGVGCGLLIPLAAGLLADTFTGKYRLQQLGIKSGISNLSLVGATFAVGWLAAAGDWHLPFLVYLIPVIPLVLSPFLMKLRTIYHPQTTFPTTTLAETASKASSTRSSVNAPKGERVVGGFIIRRLVGVMIFYFVVCFGAVVLVYYLPFLMQSYGISSSVQGLITALFFLAIFIPGLLLPKIIKALGQSTTIVALALMAIGIVLMGTVRAVWMLEAAAFITGLGYGIAQPVIYDKTVQTVVSDSKATLALSFVLAINYLAITVAPFLIDAMATLLGATGDNHFAFYFNAAIIAIFAIIGLVMIRTFTFRINTEYID